MKLKATTEKKKHYPTKANSHLLLKGILLGAGLMLGAPSGCTHNPRLAGSQARVHKDRDNDGLPDTEDRCPDTAGPRSNKGCPVPRKMGEIKAPRPPQNP